MNGDLGEGVEAIRSGEGEEGDGIWERSTGSNTTPPQSPYSFSITDRDLYEEEEPLWCHHTLSVVQPCLIIVTMVLAEGGNGGVRRSQKGRGGWEKRNPRRKVEQGGYIVPQCLCMRDSSGWAEK